MDATEPRRQTGKKRTEDSNDAHTVDIVSVSTPMDSVLRSGCEASVDWWTDGEHAFVDVDLEIGAVEPVTLCLHVDDVRDLAAELTQATERAELEAEDWIKNAEAESR
jgi:hypothetical protein